MNNDKLREAMQSLGIDADTAFAKLEEIRLATIDAMQAAGVKPSYGIIGMCALVSDMVDDAPRDKDPGELLMIHLLREHAAGLLMALMAVEATGGTNPDEVMIALKIAGEGEPS